MDKRARHKLYLSIIIFISHEYSIILRFTVDIKHDDIYIIIYTIYVLSDIVNFFAHLKCQFYMIQT